MWHSGRRQRLKNYVNAPITQHLLLWSLVAILGLTVNALGFFYWGYDYGLKSVGASAVEVQQLRQQTQIQNLQLPELKKQILDLQQNLDIAQQTAQKLQQDNKNQLNSVADMQEQIAVYQRLLGTKNAANTLNIDSFSLRKLANNQYQYRILLTHNQPSSSVVRIMVKVLGLNKNQQLNVAPSEVSFQYFQSVTGELTLPESFSADSIEFTVQGQGKKAVKIQKRFKWDAAT